MAKVRVSGTDIGRVDGIDLEVDASAVTVEDGVAVVDFQVAVAAALAAGVAKLVITDGITAPGTVSGKTSIYVDTADGDLKAKFGDGTTKVVSADT